MAMTKKDFIAVADAIRAHNVHTRYSGEPQFLNAHLDVLADFCATRNSRFNRERWLGYIAGENGPNGGKL